MEHEVKIHAAEKFLRAVKWCTMNIKITNEEIRMNEYGVGN
jgi:hypothetical protein